MAVLAHCAGTRGLAGLAACSVQLKRSQRLLGAQRSVGADHTGSVLMRSCARVGSPCEWALHSPAHRRRCSVRCLAKPPPMRDASGQPNTSQMLVFVPPHPLLKHWLAVARSSATPPQTFRSALAELGRLLIYEVGSCDPH